jgi:hypothetical protein
VQPRMPRHRRTAQALTCGRRLAATAVPAQQVPRRRRHRPRQHARRVRAAQLHQPRRVAHVAAAWLARVGAPTRQLPLQLCRRLPRVLVVPGVHKHPTQSDPGVPLARLGFAVQVEQVARRHRRCGCLAATCRLEPHCAATPTRPHERSDTTPRQPLRPTSTAPHAPRTPVAASRSYRASSTATPTSMRPTDTCAPTQHTSKWGRRVRSDGSAAAHVPVAWALRGEEPAACAAASLPPPSPAGPPRPRAPPPAAAAGCSPTRSAKPLRPHGRTHDATACTQPPEPHTHRARGTSGPAATPAPPQRATPPRAGTCAAQRLVH